MNNKKKYITLIILIFIFFITLYCSAFVGHNDNGFHLLKKAFNLTNDTDSILIEALRIPRVIKAMVAGSCIAISGMLLQTVSKNPLAEPYITGISSGAGLGIVFSVLFCEGYMYSVFGFAGALISSLLVILFCGLGRFSITKLILVGLSVNMFTSSIISFLILKNAEKSYSLMYILTGNITENSNVSILMLSLIFVFALILSALFIPKLNFLRLDSNLLDNKKEQKFLYDIFSISLSAFLAALSVLSVGILSFIGIIAPQISKILIGNDNRWLLFANILTGSIFVLFADFLSRMIIYPMQIPLGLVIAFIGAPIFIFFLVKKEGLFND